MSKPIRVLIAGPCEDFRYLLSQIFAGESDISLVDEAKNGGEALEKTYMLSPEVVVLDPQLPGGDGLGVLKDLLENSPRTQVVVVSSVNTNSEVKNAIELGACDYVAKPCSAGALLYSVRRAAAEKDGEKEDASLPEIPPDVMFSVVETLKELNMPSKMKGATYLKYSLSKAVKDRSTLNLVTKTLYPELAKKFDSTTKRVEKAIRNAIEVSWRNCDRDTKAKYFGSAAAERAFRPSNKEFMGALTDYLSVRPKEKYN